ncbi:MAG: fibrillarin-like rRNA/tRNA 2'-O-methyltransferase, partial [Candidatus Methanomethylicia archaeon]
MSLTRIYEDNKFKGVYWCDFDDGSKKLATINMVPGLRVYGEQLVTYGDVEFRIWNPYRSKLAAAILKEIKARLGFMVDVGLGYLTLDRTSGSLSGGEAQRIRLATQVGSGLVGVCYVLDEPTIGLHKRDNLRLLGILKRLSQ